MSADLRDVMLAYISGPRNPDEPLFKSKLGNRMSTSAIDHLIRQFARETGVEMSCHTFRHTMIRSLVKMGIDICTVAEIAGHSRLETTRRYSLPSANDKLLAVEKLDYGAF